MSKKLSKTKMKPLNKEEGKRKISASSKLFITRQNELNKLQEFKESVKTNKYNMLKEANEKDDKLISKLEKKLHINKNGETKKGTKVDLDGLEYILEVCSENLTAETSKPHALPKEKLKKQEKSIKQP